MLSIPKDLKPPTKVINFSNIVTEKKHKMINKSLKLISEGKVSIIIDATQPIQSPTIIKTPLVMQRPPW